MGEKIIISLGGSLIIPEELDTKFLSEFKELIEAQVSAGKKFVIITGGGKICRKYQEGAQKIKKVDPTELDWLGIYSTRFNAEFVKILFGDIAEERMITDPTLPIALERPIVLGGGWKPGWSTDYVAAVIGKQLGVKRIVNLSNIDYAYDKDPNKFPDAKKIENITWAEYEKLIPKKWNPGLSTPFDPIASKMAETENMEVVILNGKNIDNLKNCLNGEKFIGTVIS